MKVHPNQDTAAARETIGKFTLAVNEQVVRANQELTEGFFLQAYNLGYQACMREFGITPDQERKNNGED